MNRHQLLAILGIALVVAGVFLPRDGYNPLVPSEPLPLPPIDGLTLLQISIVLEGLVLIWLGLRRWTFTRLTEAERLQIISTPTDAEVSHERIDHWLLAAITLFALVLRLVSLNTDLWIDEIAPLVAYAPASLLQVLVTYGGSNHHLLNTLLVKIAVTLFGEQEWVVRLPAVVFGTATIPALYWVARQVMSRRASLAVALLLAVSYHHIFFSQNARGYTAYLFFSLVSSRLLVMGLREDRSRVWALYILTTVLNFASLLISSFVLAAHLVVGALALLDVQRRGLSPLPLLRRLIAVYALIGLLVFQLYAMVLPQMYAVMRTVYVDPASGYAPLSLEFFAELLRGIASGFGLGVVLGALPLLIMGGVAAAIGFVTLLRRNWALMLALTMPGLIHIIFLTVGNLVFSPRFFLLALPVAILSAVQGIDDLTAYLARRLNNAQVSAPRLSAALLLILCAASLFSLRTYYVVPKQPYRDSLSYVESTRRPGDIVVVIHLAEAGYRYYGKHYGIAEGQDYFYVRSLNTLNAVLAAHPNKRCLLVTTFARALQISYPDLYTRIEQGWTRMRTFPATIGDGDIAVWVQRQS